MKLLETNYRATLSGMSLSTEISVSLFLSIYLFLHILRNRNWSQLYKRTEESVEEATTLIFRTQYVGGTWGEEKKSALKNVAGQVHYVLDITLCNENTMVKEILTLLYRAQWSGAVTKVTSKDNVLSKYKATCLLLWLHLRCNAKTTQWERYWLTPFTERKSRVRKL